MDQQLLKQLTRQLRFLNIMIASFGIFTLLSIAAIGFLLFQVITFAKSTGESLQGIQQQTTEKLDIKSQACSDESLGSFLKNNSTVCN